LLAIPLLTFFTLEPMTYLAGNADWREDARRQVGAFKAAAAQAHTPLPPGLGPKLRQIITEEQDAIPLAQPSVDPGNPMRPSDEAQAQRLEQARMCSERIQQRIRPLLDAKQFDLFQRFEARNLERATERIQRSQIQVLRPFYLWLVDFYLLLALPLYCLTTCGSMIRDEVQADTLSFLITRPLKRAGLFLVKYVCQILWLEAIVAVHAVLLYAAGFARQAPGSPSTMALFFGAQFLAVLAWGALSALLGLITRRYLLLGIAYGFVVEIGIGHIPTNINSLSLTRHLQGLLGHHPLLNQLYDWAPQNAWLSVGVLLLAMALFLCAGAAVFTFREFHQASEMQR